MTDVTCATALVYVVYLCVCPQSVCVYDEGNKNIKCSPRSFFYWSLQSISRDNNNWGGGGVEGWIYRSIIILITIHHIFI